MESLGNSLHCPAVLTIKYFVLISILPQKWYKNKALTFCRSTLMQQSDPKRLKGPTPPPKKRGSNATPGSHGGYLCPKQCGRHEFSKLYECWQRGYMLKLKM